jgi:hypothetical protein
MWNESNEAKIRRLEDDLYYARRAVVTLLPQPIRELVRAYRDVETGVQADTWEEELVEAVIELAWPSAMETTSSDPRAYCPLCRAGSSEPYVEGFALPGGLRIHLLGERTARPCEVLTPVLQLARADWMPRVRESEARERAAAEAEKELRREREDQFLVDPRSAPVLGDEPVGFQFHFHPRDNDSLAWAEARLRHLGFSEHRDGRIRQFTKDHGAFTVFGDPRELGRLTFLVLRSEPAEKRRGRRRQEPDAESFHLLDSWRNDLNKKFEMRLESAIESLTRTSKKR